MPFYKSAVSIMVSSTNYTPSPTEIYKKYNKQSLDYVTNEILRLWFKMFSNKSVLLKDFDIGSISWVQYALFLRMHHGMHPLQPGGGWKFEKSICCGEVRKFILVVGEVVLLGVGQREGHNFEGKTKIA